MKETNCVQGVSCDVTNCVYNAEDNICHARHIQVANQAQSCDSKTDTFCGTFSAR